ncbi:MAG: LytR/AlgR family response regulator transcription factor [Crocinitomicaceae bacterium]
MKSIKALIVDDESAARDVLSNLLYRISAKVEVLDTAHDVPDAVQKIKALKPDVVFLDVQMPNYAGYEIVQFFDFIDFEIIFVTAYDEYAIKAFELSAVDYLVKPINRIRLKEAIEKLDQKLLQKGAVENYEILREALKEKELGKIVIPELGSKRVLLLNDIIAIEASGAYSKIHLKNDPTLLVSKNLKYFESTLPEESVFFRSHKSWIINLEHIQQFSKTKGEIQLSNTTTARLSKYRIPDFQNATSKMNL